MNLGFGSHQNVLLKVLGMIKNPVLELGSGEYSTELIHNELLHKNIGIVTVDHDSKWLGKYKYLSNANHRFVRCPVNRMPSFLSADKTNWGLVFVDFGNWDVRSLAVLKYKDTADYVVVHDCDYFPGNNIERRKLFGTIESSGKRNYSDTFKYWIEFLPVDANKGTPPTLLGSNKHDLNGIQIDEMKIIGTNESN
jgi:hypothetical protein